MNMPNSAMVLAKVDQIEAELHNLNWWHSEPLKPEQFDFHAAFAMDTMTFSQWLQFIFIPKVRAAAEQNHFPLQSQVAAQAIREFDAFPEASQLITLLLEFDALF